MLNKYNKVDPMPLMRSKSIKVKHQSNNLELQPKLKERLTEFLHQIHNLELQNFNAGTLQRDIIKFDS